MLSEEKKIRHLNIEKDIIVFKFIENQEIKKELNLKLGFEYIAKNYFKREIPLEDEIEYSINYIEDELMSNKDLFNKDEILIIENKFLNEILEDESKKEYSIEEIESIFSQYAYLSMGSPIKNKSLKITHNHYATILLVREILHHLNFEKMIIN